MDICLFKQENCLLQAIFAKVKVTGAMEYDLIGELADEYTE